MSTLLPPTEPAPQPPSPVHSSPVSPPPLPRRHHRIRWTVLTISTVVVIALLIAGWVFYRAIAVVNTKSLDGSNRRVGFFQQLTHLITQNDEELQGEADDRVNILLLGIGGPGHDGPYLTDTMIILSYKPSTDQLAMISVPRDLVVDIPGYDYRKINNVLSIGRDGDYPGGGEALTVKVVSDLINQPIHYYARVDFKGFAEVIDRVKGVTVTVEKSFYDAQYPDTNYGYDPVSFTAGVQTMTGAKALKFARSRHGSNGEGSDFARAARQQKIIFALKEKLLSFGTLSNPLKISDILDSLGSHSQTNMEVWEMVRFAKLAGDLSSRMVVNRVIDSSPDGLLKNATGLGGAFILVPRDGTYEDIKFFAHNIFLLGQADKESAEVVVANASGTTGLAESVANGLTSLGFSTETATIRSTALAQTLVVDVSNGQAASTARTISIYGHARQTISLTQWEALTSDTFLRTFLATNFTNTNQANANSATVRRPPQVVLVLGQDQPTTLPVSRLQRYLAPAKTASQKTTAAKLP